MIIWIEMFVFKYLIFILTFFVIIFSFKNIFFKYYIINKASIEFIIENFEKHINWKNYNNRKKINILKERKYLIKILIIISLLFF